jgi:hypothetical protein
VEERGSLGQTTIDGEASLPRAIRQERGHFGHDGHVLQEAR